MMMMMMMMMMMLQVELCLWKAATQLYRLLLRRSKLRADVDIWVGFATLLFKNSKSDDARKLYDQSLLSLDSKRRKLQFSLEF